MNLALRDKKIIWHPYTQHQDNVLPVAIKKGEGAYLIDESGKKYLDLISSWWVNLHGHANSEIAHAIYQQAMTLEQVIFSGLTHEPAVELAEALLSLLPSEYTKVFYTDNGSTAVESALKMAYQYWKNQGETARTRFISFRKGYHGDTFGAMSVGKQSGFFIQFNELLFEVDMFDYPATWINDSTISDREVTVLSQLSDHLAKQANHTAAIIIEPLIQGAGGMNMCRNVFLQKLQQVASQYNILVIYDEVMTGFGRTGDYFACLKANTIPDMVCVAKGITGGFLPLAATICQEKIYQAFLGDTFHHALAHGHSYTANPLGCRAGLASLNLLTSQSTQQYLKMIERVHHDRLHQLKELQFITKARYCGTIAAIDFCEAGSYGSQLSLQLRENFLARGLLIRPIGNVIYLLPPYCISERELNNAYDIILDELKGTTKHATKQKKLVTR